MSVIADLILLVLIFFDDLIYGNLQGDIVVASMTAVFIDPKFCCSHRLSIWDLSQVKTELLVVSSLVRKIFIFLYWEKKKKYNVLLHTKSQQKIRVHLLNCFLCCMTEKLSMNCRGEKKEYLSHLLLHSRSNPNILSTNKSTFQFIKSVSSIQVAFPRQPLYCVPYCILWP